jgi:hypothetical protein
MSRLASFGHVTGGMEVARALQGMTAGRQRLSQPGLSVRIVHIPPAGNGH